MTRAPLFTTVVPLWFALVVACSADAEVGPEGPEDGADAPIEPEGISVLLHVTTDDGAGLGLAGVTVGGVAHFTDGAGFLLLEQLPEGRLHARVDAPGYTSSAVAIDLGEGTHAYQQIQLFPLGPAIPFDAGQRATVQRDGVLLDIPAGSLVDAFGEPVYGLAEATINRFDPTTDELAALPGPLEGRIDEESVALITLAMAEVSLWQDGRPLQLAPGTRATLELLLPPEYAEQHQIGDSILGWSLDLDGGVWQREELGAVRPSQTTPGALAWSADVSHFTWYNIDHPTAWDNFKCYVVTFRDEQSGAVLPNKQFSVSAAVPEEIGPSGLFADFGHSGSSSKNVMSNCVLTAKGATPRLTVSGLPDYMHALPAGDEDSGLCVVDQQPNSMCAPVELALPAPILCTPGAHEICPYSGPPGTEELGICRAGRNYCIDDGTAWSGCRGEITPRPEESCHTPYDDDCDGSTSNWALDKCDCLDSTTIPCYQGPWGTEGLGICAPGVRTCRAGKYDAECSGQVLPESEVCDTDIDEDCDGLSECTSPTTPVLQLSLAPIKQFEFSWDAVPGAQYYQLLERVNPDADHVQVAGDIVGTQVALTVPLYARVNASYRLRACNQWGCMDSEAVEVSGALVDAIGYVKASNTSEHDKFGWSMALSADGKTLAIGADGEDSGATGIDGDQTDSSAVFSGAVYVFVRDGLNHWSQQAYVKASNTNQYDRFGGSLALSGDGNTLAVGSHREASSATGIDGDQADNSYSLAGAVYVFGRDGLGQWSQQAYVKASNTRSHQEFGHSVALSADGKTLAVGAYAEDSNGVGIGGDQSDGSASAAGAVYVFVRADPDHWSQQAYIKASNTDAGDWFGFGVALSGDGNTLAVSANSEDSNATGIDGDQADNSAPDAGAVYVFVRDGQAQWSQQAYIKASNAEADDGFGYSVALSRDGNTLAVGARWEDSKATGIDGDQVNNSATFAGAVYVFVRDDQTQWSQQAYVKGSNTTSYDLFGWSVALSSDGNALAVGAIAEGGGGAGIDHHPILSIPSSGAVYLFLRDSEAQWSQQAYVKASNPDPDDLFGSSVQLSGDGSMLAVGASQEASLAAGIGGFQKNNVAPYAGAAYLF